MIPDVPDRVFYRIKEVCALTGLKPHIIRYWEQEFRDIRPAKSRGQRLYRKKDLETIFTIKRLLHDKKFTIDGAKIYLSTQRRLVDEIKGELKELVEFLEKGRRT